MQCGLYALLGIMKELAWSFKRTIDWYRMMFRRRCTNHYNAQMPIHNSMFCTQNTPAPLPPLPPLPPLRPIHPPSTSFPVPYESTSAPPPSPRLSRHPAPALHHTLYLSPVPRSPAPFILYSPPPHLVTAHLSQLIPPPLTYDTHLASPHLPTPHPTTRPPPIPLLPHPTPTRGPRTPPTRVRQTRGEREVNCSRDSGCHFRSPLLG